MQSPHTAKPHTEISGAGLRKSEQLGRQLNSQNSEPPTQTQGQTVKLQMIWMLRRLTELVIASLPR